MYQINVKDIEPQNKVSIEYADSMMGDYEMNLSTNRFVQVYGALDGVKSLNTPGHQLTKTDLKEFLEDHVKEANLRLSRGKPTGIKKIEVDSKLVFEPKMITYETMPSDCLDLSKIQPKNEVRIKYGKPIYTEWLWNVKDNKFLEIKPEKDGLHYHNTRHDPMTPEKLKSFLDMHVKSADELLKTQEHCYIDSITVDGKLVFEKKMLSYGKKKELEDTQNVPDKSLKDTPARKPLHMDLHTVMEDMKKQQPEKNKIYRIGRLDMWDKVNGWSLIAAPSEEKAVSYAQRLFNQEEHNEKPYSYESPYMPVVLNTYEKMEEMGDDWKGFKPIEANDKPMPYELEIQKIEEKEKLENIKKLVSGRVIALDTETTGLTPSDEVLQLSVINEQGKKVFSEYFKPEHTKSWEGAMKFNHITPKSLEDKKPISAYKTQIETILKEARAVVGYNTGFDMTMLGQNGIDFPNEKKYVDLMMPFAKVYGKTDDKGNPKRQKLIVCADYYGFKQDGAWHDAMGDTEATIHCYRKMRNLGHITSKDVHDLKHLVNYKTREEQLAKLSHPSVSKQEIVVNTGKQAAKDLGKSR